RSLPAHPVPCLCGLQRDTLDRDPMHQSTFALIIIERIMPRGTVVPERDGTLLPSETRLEFRSRGVCIEEIQERLAFPLGPALEVRGEIAVDVKRRPAGVGMADDDGVHGVLRRQRRIDEAVLSFRVGLMRLDAEDVAAGMHCCP